MHQELLMIEDPRLIVLGTRSHTDVLGYMQEATVVVVPSLVYENQPTVILEALAVGCGVIASNVGGISETLGKAGWIVKPGDRGALKEALEEAIQPKELRDRKAERINILEQHHIEKVISRLEEVLFFNPR